MLHSLDFLSLCDLEAILRNFDFFLFFTLLLLQPSMS